MKTLLIGQAPGPSSHPEYPLYPAPRTSAGGRLAEIMGLSRGEYIANFDRVNLIPEFPGKGASKEDLFPMGQARFSARVLLPLLRGRTVVMVGRQVAQAFGVRQEWHEWGELQAGPRHAASGCSGVARVAVVPHPSGRNHWYNNEFNRALARRFWLEHLESANLTPDRKVLPLLAR